ncbi:ABC-2 type transport system permease protein [Bacillus ectoiniformans]|uniref:ABC transporter permease n=1 Tax=Bacillus ectoiniformans TaxID=1494429 RepID=UPI00195C85E7|nr:ABC transporter permease [Bacillus ectoiniformans]MBM7649008.1 ABC-2 type transport system permease protein [Bacillus ectoiniformans]
MLKLIQNEWLKIFKRPGTYVMIGLLVLMTGVFAAYMKHEDNKVKDQGNWRQEVTAENAGYAEQLKSGDLSESSRSHIKDQMKINEYRLAEGLPVQSKENIWSFIEASSDNISLIGLFVIIVAAGMVASEFTWGTIKLLLIRPMTRTKILLSKYMAMLLFGLFMMSALFILSAGAGAILFGGSGENIHLVVEGGQVVEQSQFLYLLKVYLFKSVDVLLLATMAFMISTVFKSSSLAIGLSLFLLFIGPNVTMLVAMKYDWAKYSLFANTNLLQFETGRVMVEGMTIGFSVAVLAVYFIVFHLLAFLTFAKKDVAA